MEDAAIGTDHPATPLDPMSLSVRPDVRKALTAVGFKALDTGEGCLAWSKRSGLNTHVMISANNCLDADPHAPEWIAGRYGERGGFVEVAGLTLQQAMEAAAVLRPPVRADGSVVEALYPSLDQAMDDLA